MIGALVVVEFGCRMGCTDVGFTSLQQCRVWNGGACALRGSCVQAPPRHKVGLLCLNAALASVYNGEAVGRNVHVNLFYYVALSAPMVSGSASSVYGMGRAQHGLPL